MCDSDEIYGIEDWKLFSDNIARCPCGKDRGKNKKYCSKSCMYNYMVRPSGLKYNIVQQNPSWFKKGEDTGNGFKKGNVPANFKGHDAKYAYSNIHKWVKHRKGKADFCVECGTNDQFIHYHWANISHEYKYEIDDWQSMCVKCHKEFDNQSNKKAEEVFGWLI